VLAFRHTFATVATQMGWTFERLRSAMGHSDYRCCSGAFAWQLTATSAYARSGEEFILPPGAL
jgi:hypothetical protein